MKTIDLLITKYKAMKKTLLVMDDYDGGKAAMMDIILNDLKQISDQADKALSDSLEAEKQD